MAMDMRERIAASRLPLTLRSAEDIGYHCSAAWRRSGDLDCWRREAAMLKPETARIASAMLPGVPDLPDAWREALRVTLEQRAAAIEPLPRARADTLRLAAATIERGFPRWLIDSPETLEACDWMGKLRLGSGFGIR